MDTVRDKDLNEEVTLEDWFAAQPAKQRWRWDLTTPYAASMEAWDAIKDWQKKQYPIRHFFQSKARIFFFRKYRQWIKDPWYYFTCMVWKRYNRIHVKSLPPTWVDPCTLLPHAVFTILADHIEQGEGGREKFAAYTKDVEKWLETASANPQFPGEVASLTKQLYAMTTQLEVYDYWQDRKRYFEAEDYNTIKGKADFATKGEYDKYLRWYWKEEKRLNKLEEDMLIKLIKVRRSLWT